LSTMVSLAVERLNAPGLYFRTTLHRAAAPVAASTFPARQVDDASLVIVLSPVSVTLRIVRVVVPRLTMATDLVLVFLTLPKFTTLGSDARLRGAFLPITTHRSVLSPPAAAVLKVAAAPATFAGCAVTALPR